jgi:hypothetical protein
MPEDYITLKEAVERSGLHAVTLRRLLRQGIILGYKEPRGRAIRWWVSARSLEQYTDPHLGFLLDLPGPKVFLRRRDEEEDEDEEKEDEND